MVSTRVLLIDGNSMLYRAYYALPEWRNRSGEATAGVYGFLSMMLKAIEELKPTHLAIVFDTQSGSFRRDLYVGYHANRDQDEKISKDIWGQVEKLKIVFEKMGVPVFTADHFEADDVIGTIAQQTSEPVVIITGDRDLMQLVNDRVSLFMPLKGLSDGQMVDKMAVKQRLGVWPDQVVDYKALAGDSSDSYPGVPGIGPKTAVALLEEYKTFEQVVEKAGNKKVAAGVESGTLSKILATIRTDVPGIDFDLETAALPSQEKMTEVFVELGHKSLVRRAGGDERQVDTNQIGLFD